MHKYKICKASHVHMSLNIDIYKGEKYLNTKFCTLTPVLLHLGLSIFQYI